MADDHLLALYTVMVRIRAAETRLAKLFADAEIPGFIHLSIGQEAVAAGFMSALQSGDTIATTHRGHGHVIARGIDLERFFAELMGKAGGTCGGHGGSMHVADLSLGILGANGIVGGGLAIAAGSALAHKLQGGGDVAAVFFGDGAMAEGVLHETLNLAALWALPLAFVCENNGWSEFSPIEHQFRGDLGAMAASYRIPYARIDGDRVWKVATAARDAVDHARNAGPYVLECNTHRVRGHFEGDPQKYRNPEERSSLDRYDPLALAEAELRRGDVNDAGLRAIVQAIDAELDAAVASARSLALPDFSTALSTVYAQ